MELKLDKKEIEAILLDYAKGLVPNAQFNRVEIHARYGSLDGATFDHTDIPQESEA